jgi:hypothetical protein
VGYVLCVLCNGVDEEELLSNVEGGKESIERPLRFLTFLSKFSSLFCFSSFDNSDDVDRVDDSDDVEGVDDSDDVDRVDDSDDVDGVGDLDDIYIIKII